MKKDEATATELEKLRADAAALADSTPKAAKKSKQPVASDEEFTADADAVAADADPSQSVNTLAELGQLLETEIRDRPVMSSLVIFSLGVLVGRLLR